MIVKKFLDKFDYVFTLNQDLFLEKTFGYHSLLTNRFSDNFEPINPFADLLNEKFGHPDLVTSEFEKLLQKQPYKDAFKYFKIHGSYAWQIPYHSNVHVMGVGFSKYFKVWNFPLLRIYQSVFCNRLIDMNGTLVIFGYSFGDMHINNYIYWGINNGLRLIVIGWDDFNKFKKELKDKIERTYSYDNIQIPSPEKLKIQINQKTTKIINAIVMYHPLKNQNVINFLKFFHYDLEERLKNTPNLGLD